MQTDEDKNMNGDTPIDNVTTQDEQDFLDRQQAVRTRDVEMKPVDSKPIGQGFAANDSFAERRNALLVELTAVCRGVDGTARGVMEAIELLARRIAIDMLESKEFSDRLMTWHRAYKPPSLKSDLFREKVMEIAWPEIPAPQRDDLITVIRQAQHHPESIIERAFLESDAFEQKIRAIVDERMTSNLKATLKARREQPPVGARHVLGDEDTGA